MNSFTEADPSVSARLAELRCIATCCAAGDERFCKKKDKDYLIEQTRYIVYHEPK